MDAFTKKLFEYKDEEYAKFQSKLTPTVEPKLFIGVRVPNVRKIAKEVYKEMDYKKFLNKLPHKYYDENMLHGTLIEQIKDYDECIEEVDKFLPYVDNWAVCDIMSPKIFTKHKDKLIKKIKEWMKSSEVYTCRFGIEMLMSHYLDDDFKVEYNKMVGRIKSDEYYLQMMAAWYFATALAKQWDATIPYIENKKLQKEIHNKTIQKAVESRRITDKQKEYLRKLKIK